MLIAYNAALSGSPWRLTTTPITVSRWFADGVVLRGADILATQLLRHLLWTPPALVVAYLVYLGAAPRDTRRGLLEWMLMLMAGVLYLYVERGGNQYGPRFHYEAFPFVALFVAANVFREREFSEKPPRDQWLFALLAVSVMVMPLWFLTHAAVERQVIRERMDPYTMAAAAGLHDALVLIERTSGNGAVDGGVRPHPQRRRPRGQRALRPRSRVKPSTARPRRAFPGGPPTCMPGTGWPRAGRCGRSCAADTAYRRQPRDRGANHHQRDASQQLPSHGLEEPDRGQEHRERESELVDWA